jgi:agmatinase
MINCKDCGQADVILLGAGYDRTSSYGKGADRGPQAVVAAIRKQLEFYDRITGFEPLEALKTCFLDMGQLNSLKPEEMVERVESTCGPLLRKKKFVVMLGGEHSVSVGAFRAWAKQEKASRITILQIDAHLDLRDDDRDFEDPPHGRYSHCTVMRRAVDLGFPTVQVGVRTYAKEELAVVKEKGLTVFEWGRKGEREPKIGDILASIPTDKVYLSVDADGIDPAYMPATGTPVQGGLEWWYAIDLLHAVCTEKTVIGADIVEVAPRPHDVLTEYGAAQICFNIIAHTFQKLT